MRRREEEVCDHGIGVLSDAVLCFCLYHERDVWGFASDDSCQAAMWVELHGSGFCSRWEVPPNSDAASVQEAGEEDLYGERVAGYAFHRCP